MQLSWNKIKPIIDAKSISIQWIDLGDRYWIHAVDGSFTLECMLHKTIEPTETADFEANYKPSGNKKISITDQSGIKEPKEHRARLVGIANGIATKNTTTDFDWQMQQLAWLGTNKVSYFDGVQYHGGNAVDGDTVTFQVVDKDGLSYPAGTVLEEFATNWGVTPDTDAIIRLFKSKMSPGFYIRCKYTSTGTVNDVHFICNLFRFIKTDEDA